MATPENFMAGLFGPPDHINANPATPDGLPGLGPNAAASWYGAMGLPEQINPVESGLSAAARVQVNVSLLGRSHPSGAVEKFEEAPLFVYRPEDTAGTNAAAGNHVYSLYFVNYLLRAAAVHQERIRRAEEATPNFNPRKRQMLMEGNKELMEMPTTVEGVAAAFKYAGYQRSALQQDPDRSVFGHRERVRLFGTQLQGRIHNVANLWGQHAVPHADLFFAIKTVNFGGDVLDWEGNCIDRSETHIKRIVQIVPVASPTRGTVFGNTSVTSGTLQPNDCDSIEDVTVRINGEDVTYEQYTPAHLIYIGRCVRSGMTPCTDEASLKASYSYGDYQKLRRERCFIDIDLTERAAWKHTV